MPNIYGYMFINAPILLIILLTDGITLDEIIIARAKKTAISELDKPDNHNMATKTKPVCTININTNG